MNETNRTILERILELSKKPSAFRCAIISMVFPEFYHIMGEITKLAAKVDQGEIQ